MFKVKELIFYDIIIELFFIFLISVIAHISDITFNNGMMNIAGMILYPSNPMATILAVSAHISIDRKTNRQVRAGNPTVFLVVPAAN